eukprot:NODE_71_length_23666_cov_0.239403.p11 type:complete len:155 gc:universal NODE_71_length_23666_cov_0.239403:6908-7372(+)
MIQISPRFGVQFWKQFKLGHLQFKKVDLKYYLTPEKLNMEEIKSRDIKALQKASLKHELFITKDRLVKQLYVDQDNLFLAKWHLDVEKDGLLHTKFIYSLPVSRSVVLEADLFPRKSYTQRTLYTLHEKDAKEPEDWTALPVLGFHAVIQSKNK